MSKINYANLPALHEYCQNLREFYPVGCPPTITPEFGILNHVLSYYEKYTVSKTKNYLGEWYRIEGKDIGTDGKNLDFRKERQKKAFTLFLESAKEGWPEAQYNVGSCYEHKDGIGCEQDLKWAIYWYNRAAVSGERRSLMKMSNAYREGFVDWNGVTVKPNLALAAELYRDAFDQGCGSIEEFENLMSCKLLMEPDLAVQKAIKYEFGLEGHPINFKQAFKYYLRAAEGGDPHAANWMGAWYAGVSQRFVQPNLLLEKDEGKAFFWFEKAAKQKCPNGFFSLGFCYQEGCGVAIDKTKALECFIMAGQLGHSEALLEVANYYRQGIGGQKTPNEIFEAYQKAAAVDNIDALSQLGIYYQLGYGTEKDEKEAFDCYDKAVKNGDSFANTAKGICYLKGIGTPKDYIRAFKCLQDAAKIGSYQGIALLARCYAYDLGIEGDSLFGKKIENDFKHYSSKLFFQDSRWREMSENEQKKRFRKMVLQDEAEFWTSQLIAYEEKGNLSSLYWLGECYQTGIGIEENAEKAFALYAKDSNQGGLEAALAISQCYAHGMGVLKDSRKAFKILERLVDRGNEEANYWLWLCYKYGVGVTKREKEKNFNSFKGFEETHLSLKCHEQDGTPWDDLDDGKWLDKLLENGKKNSYYWRGITCLEIPPFRDNIEEMTNMLREAAEKNISDSYYPLGLFLETKSSTYREAYDWFLKAAKTGHPQAIYKVAQNYYYGKYEMGRNPFMAIIYMEELADHGFKEAISFLEKTVGQYQGEAYQDFSRLYDAAPHGDKENWFKLGECYFKGKGVAKDNQEAIYWFKKALGQDHDRAQEALDQVKMEKCKNLFHVIDKEAHVVDKIVGSISNPKLIKNAKEFIDHPSKKTTEIVIGLKNKAFGLVRDLILPIRFLGPWLAGYINME